MTTFMMFVCANKPDLLLTPLLKTPHHDSQKFLIWTYQSITIFTSTIRVAIAQKFKHWNFKSSWTTGVAHLMMKLRNLSSLFFAIFNNFCSVFILQLSVFISVIFQRSLQDSRVSRLMATKQVFCTFIMHWIEASFHVILLQPAGYCVFSLPIIPTTSSPVHGRQ